MVARWKVFGVFTREREGRKAGASAVVIAADGRRRLVCVHRFAKRSEQSGLVAGWKDDRVHERDQSGRSRETGKEKTIRRRQAGRQGKRHSSQESRGRS